MNWTAYHLIVMKYIDGKPLAECKNGLYIINPNLKKLNFRQRVRACLDVAGQFDLINRDMVYADVKPENLLISVSDPIIWYPTHRTDLYPVGKTGLSKTEYEHHLEQWKKANKVGTVLFAYSPQDKKWKLYQITDKRVENKEIVLPAIEVQGEVIEAEKKIWEKREIIDVKEIVIEKQSPFYAELKKVDQSNARTFDTKDLRQKLKLFARENLSAEYNPNEPIEYKVSMELVDFGQSFKVDGDPNKKIAIRTHGTAMYNKTDMAPNPGMGIKSDILTVDFATLLGAKNPLEARIKKTKEEMPRLMQLKEDEREAWAIKNLYPELAKLQFNIDDLEDFNVPGYGNVQPLYKAFLNKMQAPEYDKRPNPAERLEFFTALDQLCVDDAENALVNPPGQASQQIPDNLYPSLAKLILLSEVWLDNRIQNNQTLQELINVTSDLINDKDNYFKTKELASLMDALVKKRDIYLVKSVSVNKSDDQAAVDLIRQTAQLIQAAKKINYPSNDHAAVFKLLTDYQNKLGEKNQQLAACQKTIETLKTKFKDTKLISSQAGHDFCYELLTRAEKVMLDPKISLEQAPHEMAKLIGLAGRVLINGKEKFNGECRKKLNNILSAAKKDLPELANTDSDTVLFKEFIADFKTYLDQFYAENPSCNSSKNINDIYEKIQNLYIDTNRKEFKIVETTATEITEAVDKVKDYLKQPLPEPKKSFLSFFKFEPPNPEEKLRKTLAQKIEWLSAIKLIDQPELQIANTILEY